MNQIHMIASERPLLAATARKSTLLLAKRGTAGAALLAVSLFFHTALLAQTQPEPPTLVSIDGSPVAPPASGWERIHTFTGLPLTIDGWTNLVALYQHPDYYNDSRIIYVSSSQGNDSTAESYSPGDVEIGANPFEPPGQIRPYRTIDAAVNRLRDGFPDILLLRRGDEFSSGSLGGRISGRSAAERMIFASYGTSGARPRLSRRGEQITTSTNPAQDAYRYLIYADLELYGAHKDPNSPTFQASNQSDSGFWFAAPGGYLLLENLLVRYGEVIIQGPQRRSNVAVRRSVIVDSYSLDSHAQGIFANAIDGLLVEENILDHNGWNSAAGANQTIYNHNAYLQYSNTNVIFRGNISARASSHGVHQRSGGLNENNLYLQNPLVQFGYSQDGASYGPYSGIFRHNVVLDSRNIGNSERAVGIRLAALRDAEISGNVIAHLRSGTGGPSGITYGHYGNDVVSAENVSVVDNIVYKWENSSGGTGINFQGNPPYLNITLQGNQVYQSTDELISIPTLAITEFSISGNRFFGSDSFSPGGTFLGWLAATGQISSTDTFEAQDWQDPERDIVSYMSSIGEPATSYQETLERFLSLARQQSKWNWRTEFTANAVNQYIRSGFSPSN